MLHGDKDLFWKMLTLHAKLENVSLCHYSAQVLNHLHNTCLHIRGFTSTFYATWAQGPLLLLFHLIRKWILLLK